ncbi:hypothetical protein M1M99_01725 [Thermodesulfovibrionales bacterium]|nr:hypothetical protein [Thermodesulfovibrionales bacterium]
MTGDQVHGEKFCPTCEKKLSVPLPSLCEQCGWDLESDITLNVWVTEIPEQTRNRYTQRLAIAKRNWQKLTKLEAAEKSSAGIEEPAKPQDRPAPDRLVVAPDKEESDIYVGENAQPTLENNTCRENGIVHDLRIGARRGFGAIVVHDLFSSRVSII